CVPQPESLEAPPGPRSRSPAAGPRSPASTRVASLGSRGERTRLALAIGPAGGRNHRAILALGGLADVELAVDGQHVEEHVEGAILVHEGAPRPHPDAPATPLTDAEHRQSLACSQHVRPLPLKATRPFGPPSACA